MSQAATKPARSAGKARIAYVCTECGADHSKWQGQCGECGAWNTLSEFVVEPAAGKGAAGPASRRAGWAGKADAIRAIQAPSAGTLVPVPEESVNFDTSRNLFIEGDNLDALKLLASDLPVDVDETAQQDNFWEDLDQ